ncbi:methylated-DNA-[protein]-cysteine S-methyltransferase [Candidatus Electrothrix marina]|uniref:Methylated-DNA--protein-cysteine methyltransferase n=1 Tax=Candidatus Electrothrix marina TaxID=1859130 RepID=A0A444JGU9_9BACT|nr:methylated-DNA-[protein]-cysteine S-methyltransferase [Candidatus Electrothrix marina]
MAKKSSIIYRSTLSTPIGALRLIADDHALLKINFPERRNDHDFSARLTADDHLFLGRVKKQLNEYFQGNRQCFDLSLCPLGTTFQEEVWACIQEIPYGETRTYGEIAIALGNVNKARAVGGAANKNPLPIVIPCHRVIGSSGRLTGFAGGLEIKKYLLDLEEKAR